MAIDSVFTKHLANELSNEVSNASIKRIYNISNNEFLIKFHTKKNLYISANNECRVNLTDKEFTFPQKPSNFTMLLRKYLNNFKVVNIDSFNKDRIIKIEFSGYNDLKDITSYYLYIELFGRYSNIILTSKDNIIINSLKLINSESKTILPNYPYQNEVKEEYILANKVNLKIDEALKIKIEPCTNHKDFYFTNIYSDATTSFPTLSLLLDNFYESISKQRRIEFLANQVQKKIHVELKKLKRKIKYLNNDLDSNADYEKYKNFGDLILTYGYQNKNKDILVCNDYDGNKIEIKLKDKLSVSDNANFYYSKYSKLKRSIDYIFEQIEITNNRIEFLENLVYQLSVCSEEEIIEISNEYNNVQNKKKKSVSSKILTIAGVDYTILIGKNNLQNEEVTFKLSRRNDLWFHVKDLPGSHVILKCEEITDEKIELAAKYAAYYSKGKSFPKVEVTYCDVKNIKKISGSYPGHVSILNEKNTIIVEPSIH